jgi:hypothetical protein
MFKHIRCRCHRHGKRWCWRCFWLTVSFPLEHFIWEKVPVFSAIPPLLGLH